MARRTKADAEKTRRSILDAAFGVFSQKGFTRTTLSDVAAAAGVTRGAIYWHFKDKVDLFLALSEEIEASVGVRPEDLREESVQSLEDLKREVVNYVGHFESNNRYAIFYEMVNYKTEYTEELESIRMRQRKIHREIRGKMREMFAQLKTKEEVRGDLEPDLAALSLDVFVSGLIEVWLFDRSAFRLSAVTPLLLDDLFRSMKAEVGPGRAG